ncbi:hypothetical protein H2204_009050 [Knufia peltigerae]|uniref:Transmembrane protein n=1 Tax=Knufia peltigerae TaxID=1002370 RepID=A0AA38XYY7_9EURO|nr:hypothetical protein H2204_009050 [Knufia peltigerae]
MPPTVASRIVSSDHIKTVVSRTASSTLNFLSARGSSSSSQSTTPLASVFALIIRGTIRLSSRALAADSPPAITPRSQLVEEPVFLRPRGDHQGLARRQQNVILAIPTTYAGLNSGPAPGALAGIVLGSIAGFILVLYVLLSAFRFGIFGNRQTVVEEEIVRHHHQSRRSRSRSRAMTEVSHHHHSPRRERVVREREETVVVEEHVEPSASADDDIVEVIEEHSPERPPKRGPNGRSGYRTVDPAEFGGGSRPIRKISRR